MTEYSCQSMRGFTLLEVLITVVILAFGLLGLTNLQTKLHMSQMESYQRAQMVLLVDDFASRLKVNEVEADFYRTDVNDNKVIEANEWLGKDSPENCAAPGTRAEIDRCEWHAQLLGSSEALAGANVGAALDARGCVVREQQAVPATCTPARYRIMVAWQGLYETAAPVLTCGQGLYGANDAIRRVISTTVTIGLPECL